MKEKNPYWKGKKFLKDKFIRDINRRNPHIKVKIVAERRDGKKVEIPLSKYEIFEMSDLGYEGFMYEKEAVERYGSFWKKIEFLEHDVVNDGGCYGYNKKTGKFDKKLRGEYLYKKPRWT